MTDSEHPNQNNTPDSSANPEVPTPPESAPQQSPLETTPLTATPLPQTPAEPQQPVATPQPYAQPVYQTSQPYPQPPNPHGQVQNPYGQPAQQPYTQAPQAGYPTQPPYPGYAPGQQPPMPPYPGQAPYAGAPVPPQKKKVWPWVLGACLLILVLGIGGCVSCTTAAIVSDIADSRYNSSSKPYGYDYDYNYDYGLDSADPLDALGGFSLDTIKKTFSLSDGKLENGKYTPGVYEVGADKTLMPGTYFIEGSQTAEGNFYAFVSSTKNAEYRLDSSIVYFGNYFVEVKEGDIVAFEAPASEMRMYPLTEATFSPQAPYQSGLYRVGTDIPAGSYTINAIPEAMATATQESAAFVMKDLEFNTDSITDTKYVLPGGTQTVTVKDGDYLELYAASATPAGAAKTAL